MKHLFLPLCSFIFCTVCFSINHTLKAKGYNRNITFGNKCTDVLKCLEGINSIHFWQMNFNILATKYFSNEIVLTFTFTFNFVFPLEYCFYQILYFQHLKELLRFSNEFINTTKVKQNLYLMTTNFDFMVKIYCFKIKTTWGFLGTEIQFVKD